MAVGLGNCYCSICLSVVPVGNEPLETTDSDRLELDAESTLALTLSLLGTYASAYCGKG